MAMKIKISWVPQPRQLTFLRACGMSHPFDGGKPGPPVARVIGYGGAAGGGKSDALLAVGIIAGLTFPGINIGYFRREYPMLEGPGGAIMRSQELMSGWAKWHGGQRRWTFPTRAILQFCHCKHEDDVYGYQSQQFDILLFDEATQFTRFMVRYLMTRNRATQKGVIPFAAMGTNPGNVGHGWFLSEFVEPGSPEQVHDVEVEPGQMETHIFIPAKLSDNKVLERRDPGYRATLEAQTEDIRRQLLEGDWSVFAGQVFREFRRDVHVVDPFVIPRDWRRWRALDFGYTNPACCLWLALGPDEKVYVYRELYVTQMRASELAQKIVELSRGENITLTLGDPACWAKTGHEGESIEQTMRQNGLPMQRADNDRLAGKQRVHDYLTVFEGWDGKPASRLKIFRSCVNLIRTLPQLVHDQTRPEDVDTDGEDHAYDALRYGLMNRPAIKTKRSRQSDVPAGVSPITGY